MEDRLRLVHNADGLDTGKLLQSPVIEIGNLPARFIPLIEMRQLDLEDSRLNRVKTKVMPNQQVMILLGRSMIAQQAHLLSQINIVGNEGSAISSSTEIFSRIKTEAGGFAENSGALSFEASAMRLAGVLENRQATIGSYGLDLVHPGRLPVKMHRQNHPGFFTDCR